MFSFSSVYSEKISALKKKILVCGVIKNGEKGFKNAKKCILNLVERFYDYRVIIHENNSSDNTKNLYMDWANSDKKLIFSTDFLSKDFITAYTPRIGDYRCEFIARARNIVLSKALLNEFDDFDYVLMADLDEFGEWDIQGIINTIENPEFEWDMVCANGSYDIYPVRSPEFRLSPEIISYKLWLKFAPIISVLYSNRLRNSGWYRVESAFGGIAIYKREALKGCTYKAFLTEQYVDWLLNLDFSQDLLYLQNPKFYSKFISKNLKKLSEWKDKDYERNSLPCDVYASEHVQLHFQMIKNGFDKIYVNPNWKHKSLEYKNY
jgi:hypothetical protein